ncbi:Protein kinase-like domain protein [Niveomyces insectorum RCEF 264]|uniref:Protein kinase-like domain protein n=1 Tax=Niveomyces insectorum RCEF 264 TaxID=1081102 RepID=A0A167TCV6_9HYPO|nr:Protein kinase-like domain protein [Niveomyces insectorum RCEF 264]
MSNAKRTRRVSKVNYRSPVARLNASFMRTMEQALKRNPEMDLTSIINPTYSFHLETRIKSVLSAHRTKAQFPSEDVRSRLRKKDKAFFVYGPTPALRALLEKDKEDEDEEDEDEEDEDEEDKDEGDKDEGGEEDEDDDDDDDDDDEEDDENKDNAREHPDYDLAQTIVHMVENGKRLYNGVAPASRSVFRLSDGGIVCKFASPEVVRAEYHALVFLQQVLPDFPAPRAHGLARFGAYGLLFSDFIDGHDLAREWPGLAADQKQHLSRQLDGLLAQLRTIPRPAGMPLGALHGGGCRDDRRCNLLRGHGLMTTGQFEDWVLSGSTIATPGYIRFIRELRAGLPPPQVYFTHGDIRRENLLVRPAADGSGRWDICAVIDWEYAGFYPDYWEAVKMTTNMNSTFPGDWYNYLPASAAPKRYTAQWLVERVWGTCLPL